jgi:hypothetical protein
MRGNDLSRWCGLWGFISPGTGIDKSIEKELLWFIFGYKTAIHATFTLVGKNAGSHLP